ncbi:MAG TPA: hypothetical protein VF591_26355 [Pyrinomonadaceae bacterium]|jgi:type IV secretory pathway VirB10-like protein
MRQRPENFNPAGEDPEATLVAPRFDADDARRAHPVVPLAEAHASRGARAHTPRRSWANALLAVVLLAVAALGGAVATKFMQSPREERGQEVEQVQERTQAAPAQTAEAPPPQPSTPQAADAPREDVATTKAARRETRTRRARAAVESAREDVYEDEDGERRAKAWEKRREREDEVEKEMRKALKRAKGKAPRLVDVLTSSP